MVAIRDIVYITEKRAHQHAQNATFWVFAAASLFRLRKTCRVRIRWIDTRGLEQD